MKLLITGICGFVGSALAKAIVEQSAPGSLDIIGIDNLSRAGSWLNRDQLVKLGVRVLHGDIRESCDLDAVGPVDWVIDAAFLSPAPQSDGETAAERNCSRLHM